MRYEYRSSLAGRSLYECSLLALRDGKNFTALELSELLLAWACARQRALDPVQALAVGAVGILAVAPGWARDLGFQLLDLLLLLLDRFD